MDREPTFRPAERCTSDLLATWREERELKALYEHLPSLPSRGELPASVDAEDTAQEALIKAWRRRKYGKSELHVYHRDAHAESWRRERFHYVVSLDAPGPGCDGDRGPDLHELVPDEASTVENQLAIEAMEAVAPSIRARIAALPWLRQRQVELRSEGLGHEAVAEVLRTELPDAEERLDAEALRQWWRRWARTLTDVEQMAVGYQPCPEKGRRQRPGEARRPARQDSRPAAERARRRYARRDLVARARRGGYALERLLELRERAAQACLALSWQDAAAEISQATGVPTLPEALRRSWMDFVAGLPPELRRAAT